MKENTKMCKLKPADWEDGKADIRDRVRGATHVCSRCFRVSRDPKLLCKPKKIK